MSFLEALFHDGVILFVTSQSVAIEDKFPLNLKQLFTQLELLFSQIVLEIYENMRYKDRLSIDIECFGLNHTFLQVGEYPGIRKLPIDKSFAKSYILNPLKPIKISSKITQDIRNIFIVSQ